MNLDSLTAALSHIGNLIQTLAKKNIQYDSCYCQEIVEVSWLKSQLCLINKLAAKLLHIFVNWMVWDASVSQYIWLVKSDILINIMAA